MIIGAYLAGNEIDGSHRERTVSAPMQWHLASAKECSARCGIPHPATGALIMPPIGSVNKEGAPFLATRGDLLRDLDGQLQSCRRLRTGHAWLSSGACAFNEGRELEFE